jgi:hypothetical protein
MHLTKSHFKQIVLEEYTKLLNEKKTKRGRALQQRAFDYVYNLIAGKFQSKGKTPYQIYQMARKNIHLFIGEGRPILPDGDLSNELLDKYLDDYAAAISPQGAAAERRVWRDEAFQASLVMKRTMPERYWRSKFGLKRLLLRKSGNLCDASCFSFWWNYDNMSEREKHARVRLLIPGTKKFQRIPLVCAEECVEEDIKFQMNLAMDPDEVPRRKDWIPHGPRPEPEPTPPPDFKTIPPTPAVKTCRETYPDRRDAPPKKWPGNLSDRGQGDGDCDPNYRGDLTKLYACWYPSNIPGSEHLSVPEERHIRCLKHLPKGCRRVGRKSFDCSRWRQKGKKKVQPHDPDDPVLTPAVPAPGAEN